MTLGARALVLDEAGRVLLVRHTYMKGLFLPGGGVERGETVLTSLGRELEEEAALRLIGTANLVGIFSNHRIMKNDHVCLYRVEAAAWEDNGTNPIGREISELVWCDPADPPSDTTPGTKRRLHEHVTGAQPPAHW